MDWINGIIQDFWTAVSDFLSTDDDSFLSGVYNILGGLLNLVMQWIAHGWSLLFDNLLSFLYSIFFGNYEGTVNTGKFAIENIFSFQGRSTSLFSVDMIYFFFGCIIMVFIFKFVIQIVLRLVGMLR